MNLLLPNQWPLKEYKKDQDRYKKELGKKWQGTNRLFTDPVGKHMHPGTCNKILQKITKKYGLRNLKFHELRHTCTSLLINKGMNPKVVSQRLGHANPNITMSIYTHVYESSKIECANSLNSIISNI